MQVVIVGAGRADLVAQTKVGWACSENTSRVNESSPIDRTCGKCCEMLRIYIYMYVCMCMYIYVYVYVCVYVYVYVYVHSRNHSASKVHIFECLGLISSNRNLTHGTFLTFLQAVEKKFPEKFFYAGWMGPERYALLAGCDFTLLPSRWKSGVRGGHGLLDPLSPGHGLFPGHGQVK